MSVMTFVFLLLALCTALGQVTAIQPPGYVDHSKRGTCNSNNCLRALLSPQHSSAAINFCQTYIPASTITVPTTYITTETFTTQAITTVIVTRTSTLYSTSTFTHSHTLPTIPFPPTTTLNSTSFTPPFANSTSAGTAATFTSSNSSLSLTIAPRDNAAPTFPTFLSACSYNSVRISSACSCVVAPVTYVTGTVTSYVVTDVIGTLPTSTATILTAVYQNNTTTVTLYEP